MRRNQYSNEEQMRWDRGYLDGYHDADPDGEDQAYTKGYTAGRQDAILHENGGIVGRRSEEEEAGLDHRGCP